MNMKALLSLVFTLLPSLYGMDFIIPIDLISLNDYHISKNILVTHLRGDHETRLYLWDEQTKEMTPAIAPLYNPIMIRMLPSHQEFSFIDNGRLRIKCLDARAAKAISINDKKLIETGMYSWLDDNTCLLCAWKHRTSIADSGAITETGTYGIYKLLRNGTVTCLVSSPEYDAIFPLATTDSLFFVRREAHFVVCSVMRRDLNNPNEEECIIQNVSGGEFDYVQVVDDRHIYCFLYENDLYTCFKCIKDEENNWESQKAFSFRARGCGYQDPYNVLTPLLINNNLFIYIDNIDLCYYNITTAETGIIDQGTPERLLCAPRYINNLLYCGCGIQSNDDFLWKSKGNELYCDLPCFDIGYLLQSEAATAS